MHLAVQGAVCLLQQLADLVLGSHLVGVVGAGRGVLEGGAVAVAGVLHGLHHILLLLLQLGQVRAPGLGDHLGVAADDVGGTLRLEGADVGGGLLVHPQKLHMGNALGSRHDGADSRLRLQAGVRGLSEDLKLEVHLSRAGVAGGSDVSAHVEHHSHLPLQLGVVRVLGAVKAALLPHGEEYLHRAGLDVLLLHRAQGLHDAADAGLVVRRQNHGVRLAVDPSVLHVGSDGRARHHRVQMGAENDGLQGRVSVQVAVHIEAVGAKLLPDLIHVHPQAQILQILLHPLTHLPLVSRLAVDLHILEECVHQSLLVHEFCLSFFVSDFPAPANLPRAGDAFRL